jgi:hypothetical protein
MPPRRKLPAFRGPLAEVFSAVVWDEGNRAVHEAKRPKPRFEAARLADWTRIFKRLDVEHSGSPQRYQALVGRELGLSHAV